MTTPAHINTSASNIVRDLWHELPGCDTNPEPWEYYFRIELSQLVQDHSHYQFKGSKLIKWVRNRAQAVYKRHIESPAHLATNHVGFLNYLSAALLAVLNVEVGEVLAMSQYNCFVFVTAMQYATNQGAIGWNDYDNTANHEMFFDIGFN